MALHYTVSHAFYSGATYFTRANQQDVKGLPREERDKLIALGFITEQDDRKAAAGPDAPATTATGAK